MNPTRILLSLVFCACLLACEDILEVPDISNESVEILAPTDQSTVTEGEVGLSWSGLSEAEAYRVQLATPDFEQAAQILLDSTIVLDSTFLGTQVFKTLPAGNFEWRVRAYNSDYSTPFSSAAFSVSAP